MSSHVHLHAGRRRLAATLVLALLVASCGQPVMSTIPAPSASVGAGSSPGRTGAASPQACSINAGPTVERQPWSDRIFYEVFVRSFQDSDGDGIGDLRGLTSRLDQLNDGDPATTEDLGVTGLWLMPIAESPSYHGYDVVDYRAIETDYGTADDFRALIAAAHERGIVVIVDLVLNHSSRDHPWFRDALTPGSVHDDWYVWSDSRPHVARSDGSRVWHEAGGRFYYGYFWEGMPDLNLENADVTAELDDLGRFWLEEMGVDGFRLDAARHLIEDGKQLENTPETFEWLKAFRERRRRSRRARPRRGVGRDIDVVPLRPRRRDRPDLDFGLRRRRSSRSTRATPAPWRRRCARSPRRTRATRRDVPDEPRPEPRHRPARRTTRQPPARRGMLLPGPALRSSTTARRSA